MNLDRDEDASAEADAPPPKGWYSRGYLPHFDGGEVAQMVTFRLAGSFPRSLLAIWQDELVQLAKREADAERRRRIEAYLDKGTGLAWLCDASIARLVEQSLLFFDGDRYRLHAWVVMPNHVHVLLTPLPAHTLSAIVHSWKSYTSNRANRLLHRSGDFWHRDYFDRAIRNEQHYVAAIAYVEGNPLRAGLCASVADWAYGSASRR